MRVPPRFRNRIGYTVIAALCAATVTLAFVAILDADGMGVLVFTALVTVFAAISAYVVWPRELARTGRRMFGRGVLIGFAVHLALALFTAFSSLDVEMFFGMMLLSVIVTLGIPILLAGAVSWLFRSEPDVGVPDPITSDAS